MIVGRWGDDAFCYGCYQRKPRSWFVLPGRRNLSRKCTACWAVAAVKAKALPAAPPAPVQRQVMRVGCGKLWGDIRLDNVRYVGADQAVEAASVLFLNSRD